MAFEARPDIYSDFIRAIELNDYHRKELREKRGLTDETIKTLRFRSGGDYSKDVIEDLKKVYTIGELYACGLIEKDGRAVGQVVKDQIIIPFLSDDSSTYFMRSHKYSLRESGVQLYCKKIYNAIPSDTVILAESEYKSAALYQLGYKTFGLCGISSFAASNIDTLANSIRNGTQKVYILFDTETQDNPEFTNYKNDFRKRYASPLYSFILGRRLEALLPGIQIMIATLPKAWEIEGKADVDGCVAAGHTRQEFDAVFAAAMKPSTYIDFMDVKPNHRSWVQRKIHSALETGIIFDIDNSYWIDFSTKENPKKYPISNFIINVKSILEKDSNVIREIELINKFGDKSRPFFLSAEEISSYRQFKMACLNRGDYIWKGSERDFNALNEHLFLESDVVPIRMRQLVGRDDEYGQWIFGNLIIKDDGTEIEPNKEDGVTFRSPDEGYRIDKLNSGPLPVLSKEPIDLDEIFHKFNEAWGLEGILALSYSISTLFSDAIFEKYQLFPFLNIYGEKASGKSTLSDAMMFPLGFPAHHASMNLNDTTGVGLNRHMAFYHSLPCRFDEYRNNEKKIDDKQSILRSIYNRQRAAKGMRAAFGTREVEPKGAFVLIGEEKPTDPAFLSRCIPVYLSHHNNTKESYEASRWIYDNASKLSFMAYHLLKNYKVNAAKFIADMEATRVGFKMKSDIIKDFRTQIHYAMLIVALTMCFKEETVMPFINRFYGSFEDAVETGAHDSAINRFFADLNTMRMAKMEEVSRYMAKEYANEKHIAIFFPGLYSAWAKDKAKKAGNKDAFGESTLRNYLKSQPYFLNNNALRRLKDVGDDKRVNCIIIDSTHPLIPLSLKNFIDDCQQKAMEIS